MSRIDQVSPLRADPQQEGRANRKSHVCCTCARPLAPTDAAVYLGWGRRYDGRPGLGWVAALCAPTTGQMLTGSPCVAACRAWAEEAGVDLHPSDREGWEGKAREGGR